MSNTTKRHKRITKAAMQRIDQTVLTFISEHRNVTHLRLQKHTKASPATVSRVIRRLIAEQKVERVNSGKRRIVYFKLAHSAPVVAKQERVFPVAKVAEASKKISFALHNENGTELISIKADSSDTRVLSILSSVISGLK